MKPHIHRRPKVPTLGNGPLTELALNKGKPRFWRFLFGVVLGVLLTYGAIAVFYS